MFVTTNASQIPAPTSKVRQAWTLLHRGLGYVAIIFAFFQVKQNTETYVSSLMQTIFPVCSLY